MSSGIILKKLPKSSSKTEEEKVPEIAEDNSTWYEKAGKELMGTDDSWIARKKKALRDKISDWSIDNINMPLKNAGYPNAGAMLGAIPETIADVAIPGSGLEILPMNKITAGVKGVGRLGIRESGKEFNALRKAKITEDAHNAIAKDTKGFRADTITSPERNMQRDFAAAEVKLGRKFTPEEAEMARISLQKKYMPDAMKDAGVQSAEQRAIAAGAELNKKPEVTKQVFKSNPLDDPTLMTPVEIERVLKADVGSQADKLEIIRKIKEQRLAARNK